MTVDDTKKLEAYVKSTRSLARAACHNNTVRKLVMTGAATSVTSPYPKDEDDGVYRDSLLWADKTMVTRPNEKAKYLAERAMWNTVL